MKSGPFFRVAQKHPKGEVSQGNALQSHSIQQLGMIEDVLCSLFYGGRLFFENVLLFRWW